jgi:trk system potassium uptake protein TrkA
MRFVFIGAGAVTRHTAAILIKSGHEVVIIEIDKERIDQLREELDCGIVHGDGGTPDILRETDPGKSDFLFCLTGSDQTNIIASLVGRSLGFKRVVTQINNPQYERICTELGLEDTIVPARTIARFLADMSAGRHALDLSAIIKGEARVFSWILGAEDEGLLGELDLPDETRVICCYREEKFTLPEAEDRLKAGDELVVITHSRNLPKLNERWGASARRDSGKA